MFRHISHIHFVGIGGIGMSGIAELLLNSGYKISGSDIHPSPITRRLEKLGARIFYDHKAQNVLPADVVVYSSAILNSNPELTEARYRSIPCIPRIEILGELMRMKESIAIAGTHGKTTITSMVGKILELAGLDPTIIIGGRLRSLGTNVRLGSGGFIVCETDESDKLFLNLFPIITVISSIDEDHLDNYKDLDEIIKTFIKFTNRVPFYGCNIVCIDDENIKQSIPKISKRYITYGFNNKANLRIRHYKLGLPSHFWVQSNSEDLGEFTIPLPGIHNILNATSAIAVALELELPLNIIKRAMSKFEKVIRRFELKGEVRGAKIIDDYAHHPYEIEVTLRAARTLYSGKIIVIFQPHLFSRTLKLIDRFGTCFREADEVIITPIYPARESPIQGVTGKLIVDSAISKGYKNISYTESKEELIQHIMRYLCAGKLKKGDTIFTMGAGDIYKVGEEILKKLKS
ncbi:MAG: UDP-N-acetylmuramate--L-alanine ligase [bacterium]|nr:UDP-N-acetylmuramate--L-alanine ligase [bacterium]